MSRYLKLNAAQLKYIAIITMLIDHTAIILNGQVDFITQHYDIMRNIGRIAFPIFVFMLVEGFHKTKNIKRYLGKIFIFALISEIPYNLMITGEIFNTNYQNIFFTLFLGLLMIIFMDKVKYKRMSILYTLAIFFIFSVLSVLFNVSYSFNGMIAIAIFYIAYNKSIIEKMIYYTTAFYFEIDSVVHLANLMLTFCYNGKRGKQNKMFFYLFYPLHITALLLIKYMII